MASTPLSRPKVPYRLQEYGLTVYDALEGFFAGHPGRQFVVGWIVIDALIVLVSSFGFS